MINEELKTSVMEDLTLLKYIGMNPVVVHGGGPDVSDVLRKFDIDSKFINGLRVTDSETMDIAQMVLVGKTNKEIVSRLNQMGGKAIGFCGIDGNIIKCEKYKTTVDGEDVDLGYVGKITRVDSKLIELLAKDEYIPVIAPIGVGEDGHSFNINADTVASEVAISLRAEKLMLLTDVPGVRTDKNDDKIIPALTSGSFRTY